MPARPVEGIDNSTVAAKSLRMGLSPGRSRIRPVEPVGCGIGCAKAGVGFEPTKLAQRICNPSHLSTLATGRGRKGRNGDGRTCQAQAPGLAPLEVVRKAGVGVEPTENGFAIRPISRSGTRPDARR